MPNRFVIETRNIALIILCVILFIIALDDTVLNVALPSISEGLGSTASQLLWIVDVYLLVAAALQIVFGSISDCYGRKRILQIGLIVFGLGSLGAALSTSTNMLILFRAVTGLGAGMMMPSTLSILTDVFREPKERAKAIGIWASVFGIGAGFGPIIGGYLLSQFSWHSVFYLNLPIVAIGLMSSHLFLPESQSENTPKPNLISALLSTGGLASLVYAIIAAGEYGWSASNVLIFFGVATVLLSGFVLWERRSLNAMFPLSFFKNMSFAGSAIALTVNNFAWVGFLFFFSQYLQSVQGYTPLAAGFCLLPMSLLCIIFTLLSVRIDEKIGTKLTVSLGLLITAGAILLFGFTAGINTPYFVTLTMLLLFSFGGGLVNPATNAAMNSIPANRAGVGSAMNDTTRQLGGVLGIAVLGSILNSTYVAKINASAMISDLPEHISELIKTSLQGAHLAINTLPAGVASQVLDYAKQAFIDGVFLSALVGVIILTLFGIVILIILPARAKTPENQDNNTLSNITKLCLH